MKLLSLFLSVSFCLAVKYDIQIFHLNLDCKGNTFGYAMFDESNSSGALLDAFAEASAWSFNTTVSQTEKYVFVNWLYLDKHVGQSLIRYGECSFGPRDYSVLIRRLDNPVFDLHSCESDADCEDDLACTETTCDTELHRCKVRPLHDTFCGAGDPIPTYAACVPKTCFGGPLRMLPCAVDMDCYGGICGSLICKGGEHDGKACDQASTWSRSDCLKEKGVCISGKSDGCFVQKSPKLQDFEDTLPHFLDEYAKN
jgi:hypothetical protein